MTHTGIIQNNTMKNEIQSPVNRLILGDNLEILKTFDAESVDLIYLDPPFFSNRNYEIIWGDEGEIRSFKDRWAGGISHYLDWLKERVTLMHRVLKKTGCIFLHCDWHADAYIRVEILDKIFGEQNLRNHIVWRRTNAKSNMTQRFAINTDSIYFYSKSGRFKFRPLRGGYSPEQMSRYKQEDENGLYRCDDLTSPGKARQFIWRGIDPGTNRSWRFTEEKLEELYEQGLIELQKNGMPRKDGMKMYLSDAEGAMFGNLWIDIDRVGNTSKERIGYPTQKPEALLERIIKCASNEGDLVLDPFMGGGTTLAVAERLGRRFIGIDQSTTAVKVAEVRLQKQMDMFSTSCSVVFHKYNYNRLRYEDAFEFQDWIVQQFGGEPNVKKRGDLGIDGKMPDNTPIQVKRSDSIGRNTIDNFLSAVKREDKKLYTQNIKEKKPIGYIIAFSFGKGAVEEAARLRLKENIVIELVEVSQIVPMADGPAEITVEMHEVARDMKGSVKIEFTAKTKSETEIKFYSWDFNYDEERGFKASVMVDYEGKQTYQFSAGEHIVAVKAVDDEGLESIEMIKLKVNGVVKRCNGCADVSAKSLSGRLRAMR